MHINLHVLKFILWNFMFLTDIIITSPLPVISKEKLDKSLINKSNRTKYDLANTIVQVQKILEKDPQLPRLTRGEIEELFDQLTKDEFVKNLQGDDLSRALHMRSLMLVLPYNTDNSTEQNLQELYTKPPITKVVENYSIPQPQKYPITSSMHTNLDLYKMVNVFPTTYKPTFAKQKSKLNSLSVTTYHPRNPTTYHPSNKNEFISAREGTTVVSLKVENQKIPFKMTSLPQSKINFNKQETMTLPDINNQYVTSDTTRYSSHYNAKKPHYKSNIEKFKTTDKNSKQIGPELAEVLQGLGFVAANQSLTSSVLGVQLHGQETQHKPFISSLIKQKATESLTVHQSNIAADDFKRSMMAPKLTSDVYFSFKPLKINEHETINPEMEAYLSRFGIVPTSIWKPTNNSKGAIPKLKTTNRRFARNFQSKKLTKRENVDDSNITQFPISTKSGYEQKNEQHQIEQLLKNIAQLENLNISFTPGILKQVNMEQNKHPDPNKENEFNSSNGNEIKRESQTHNSEPTRFNFELNLEEDYKFKEKTTALRATANNTDNLTITNNSSTSLYNNVETTTTSSIEESRNGSINDLEDSFGGPDPITENSLPPPKKNGFYFLADWNSFLEVGEGEEQVVVRLSKKIGDGRRFIPVQIP